MGTAHKFHAITFPAILLFAATACTTVQTTPKVAAVHQKPVVLESANLTGAIVSGAKYEIIRSALWGAGAFEPSSANQTAAAGEQQSPPDLNKLAAQTITWLNTVSREELTRRGLRIDRSTSNVPADVAARCVRTNLDAAEIRDLVQPACLARRAGMVVCQHLSAELGSAEGWAAIPIGFGVQFTPMADTSSVHFRAVLRDCGTGQERWRGEVYYRGEPGAENKEFEESVRGVYRTLSVKEARR
jgi:hypothetical protein